MCPPPDDPSSRLTCFSGAPLLDEFSSEERGLLLRLAHQAISATLEQREISLVPPSPHLAEPRGAFTTLYYRGDLQGLCRLRLSRHISLPHGGGKRTRRGF